MNEKFSETQTLLIQLHAKFDSLRETVNQIRDDTKTYPVTKSDVERHEENHKSHFKAISEVKADVNRAKGVTVAAATIVGAISGFLTDWLRK